MKTNRFTDGLAAIAMGIAVVGALLLLNGPKGIEQDTVYHELSWAEPVSPAKSSWNGG